MSAQRLLDFLNTKLPAPHIKPVLRLTGIPIVAEASLKAEATFLSKVQNFSSVYHRYSKFFFPEMTRQKQHADFRKRKSGVTDDTIVANAKTLDSRKRKSVRSLDELLAGSTKTTLEGVEVVADEETEASFSQKNSNTNNFSTINNKLARDTTTFSLLFPYSDFFDGCVRGRVMVGVSQIHARGLVATAPIPKNGVAICIKCSNFLDPVSTRLITTNPRAISTLWRHYSCLGGANFALPISANPTHLLNHSCDANLRAGFFFDPESPFEFCNPDEASRWLECAFKYGEKSADNEGFAPVLKSKPRREKNNNNNNNNNSQNNNKNKKSSFEVDWNCFVATRDIQAGEELTIDYARHIAPSYAREFGSSSVTSRCNCGATNCSGDIYRSIPARLDLVSSHAERIRRVSAFFPKKQVKKQLENQQQQEEEGKLELKAQEEGLEDDGNDEDPHDDDLVRASFLMNRSELIEKMHRSLPRRLISKGPLVTNTNAACEYLTCVLAKEKVTLPGGTMGPMDLH